MLKVGWCQCQCSLILLSKHCLSSESRGRILHVTESYLSIALLVGNFPSQL